MHPKPTPRNFIFYATIGILTILCGVYMIINDTVAVGVHSRTLQPSGFGGGFIIFVGLILLL